MNPTKNPYRNTPASQPSVPEKEVNFDGFQQVLDMLKIADPEFRESLLRRLAARDRDLANTLRRDLSR